jgi:hypothetical protein
MSTFVLQRYLCYKYWALGYEVFLMCYNRSPKKKPSASLHMIIKKNTFINTFFTIFWAGNHYKQFLNSIRAFDWYMNCFIFVKVFPFGKSSLKYKIDQNFFSPINDIHISTTNRKPNFFSKVTHFIFFSDRPIYELFKIYITLVQHHILLYQYSTDCPKGSFVPIRTTCNLKLFIFIFSQETRNCLNFENFIKKYQKLTILSNFLYFCAPFFNAQNSQFLVVS